MRALEFFIGLVAAVILHMVLVRVTGGVSLAVDLFLLLALFNALDGNPTFGLLGGLVAGLTADTLTGGLYGLHGFADTLAGYGLAVATRRLVIQRATGIFLAFSLAAAVQQAILVGLRLVLLPETSLPSIFGLVTRVLGVGVLGFLGYAGRKRWILGVQRWRSSRTARLR
jgi:rod shape-determining protein MreD